MKRFCIDGEKVRLVRDDNEKLQTFELEFSRTSNRVHAKQKNIAVPLQKTKTKPFVVETPVKKWSGLVLECDICNERLDKIFIDGRTIYGPWANMCPICHQKYGVGLGLGKGQIYGKQNDEWVTLNV